MRLKSLLTTFVMLLIVSLPISFADITGGVLEITRSSGNEDIEGLFDGYEDNWNIEVRASIGDDAVTPSYLQAQFPRTTLPFDSCSEIAHPFYSCSLKFPENPASFPENELVLPIVLTHPVTGDTESIAAQVGIDAHAPIVTVHSIVQQGDDAVIDYTVEDSGNRVCSIDKIEFLDSNFVVLEIAGLNITDCDPHRNQTLVPLSDIGTSSKVIRTVAYDLLGHTGDAISDTFILDNSPPNIDISSFVFSAIGQDQFIPSNAVSTTISINIVEEQTTPGVAEEPLTVTADFSQLGLTSAEPADNCDLIDTSLGIYTCIWDRFVTIPESFSITIVAEDNNQISSTGSVSKIYSVDEVPPVIEYLGGNKSKFILVGSNTLRATLREAQSGINPDHIVLDITGINPSGSFDLRADECIQSGDLWNCYWNDIIVTKAGSISLIQAKDIANNFVLDLLTVSLEIDADTPVVESIEILSLGGVQTEPVTYHEEGSYLEITANVSDVSGVKATANFVQVISNVEEVGGSCVLADANTNQWLCTWSSVGPLTSVAATTTKDIQFRFEDFAGNELQQTEPIDILDIGIAEPNPDYWRSTAGDPMPLQIDREIAGLISPIVFVPVSLSHVISASPNSKWPVLVKDITCGDGSEFLHTSYPPEIFNYNPTLPGDYSVLPYTFYVKLTVGTIPPSSVSNTINVNCSFNVMSYINGQTVPNPERESVILTANFYNNPLGTVDYAVQSEIDHVKDGWLVKGDWIDWITTFLYWSELACQTSKTIYDIMLILGQVKDGLASCCSSGEVYTKAVCCPTASSSGAAEQALAETNDKYYIHASKFCKIINCQLGREGDDLGTDAQNSWSNWVSFAQDQSPGDSDANWYWGNLEPKNSMILSVVFLCPTGFFYNLEKARQIECKYAYCLEQSAVGMPVDLCVTQRSFAMCMWVWNEIFQFIPFADMTDDLLGSIGDVLDNPGQLLNIAAKEGCKVACQDPTNWGCNICEVAAWADWLVNVLCDLGVGEGCEPYWETLDPIPQDYCEMLVDD